MKKFVKWLQEYAKSYIKNYVKNNKNEIVAKINKKVDLPFLNEKQEGELIESVYEIIVEVFDDSKDSSK
jgi:nickel-dependent lactate racemase|tara:strand:+ start:143 stop:349 length:207 start_codon:yes stop_codon:yes gene_type:complete